MSKLARGSPPAASLVEEELQRLIESPGLQHAESLRQLLRYLVIRAIERPHEHIGEYQIALDVFGRPETFDPRLDSAVRVQTSRLRNKLLEYYATTGVQDPLIIDIPRGSYTAVFHPRQIDSPALQPPAAAAPLLDSRLGGGAPYKPSWLRPVNLIAGLAAGLIFGLLFYLWQPSRQQSKTNTSPEELRTFWGSVLKSSEPPLVIFSNAEFTGRPETGLRYFNSTSDSREHVNDLYTGVGEVLAIAELSNLFRGLNRDLVVKRGGLLTWDETTNRDLIFAGSPTENLSLRDLPLSQEFVFRAMRNGEPRPGDLAIVNEHPQPGEPRFFLASADLPITEDYGVVAFQAGLHPRQSVLLLAGTTTLGTQAAAEFVCQNDSLAALRKRLGLAPGRPFTPFSAVLRVRVTHGVPVESTIAAIHSIAR